MNARYDDDENGGDWDEYKKLVLSRIRELREDNQSVASDIGEFRQEVNEKFTAVEKELAQLNVKSGLWGALAGAVLAGGSILFQMVVSR